MRHTALVVGVCIGLIATASRHDGADAGIPPTTGALSGCIPQPLRRTAVPDVVARSRSAGSTTFKPSCVLPA